jgi:hypothetical protein
MRLKFIRVSWDTAVRGVAGRRLSLLAKYRSVRFWVDRDQSLAGQKQTFAATHGVAAGVMASGTQDLKSQRHRS